MKLFKTTLTVLIAAGLMSGGWRLFSAAGRHQKDRAVTESPESVRPEVSPAKTSSVTTNTLSRDHLDGDTPPAAVLPVIVPERGLVNVDRLPSEIVLDRRVKETETGEVQRLFLVKGGGSYPYHRIEELLRYDAAKDAYIVARQTMIVADHFMVKLQPGCTQAELEAFNTSLGTRIISETGFPDVFMIQLVMPSLNGVPEMMSAYAAETNLILRTYVDSIDAPSAVPNDTNWSSQWDKQRIGCSAAWDVVTGSTNIIIAIIDTGVDMDHPDLAAHLWRNPGEAGAKASNGIDDDGNGYVDDWIGWDWGTGDGSAGSGDNNPDDNGDADNGGDFAEGGHGTHCAGIAGAIGNNATQVAGVCWNVTIMALKPFEYMSGTADMRVYSSKAILAMKYAANKGAKVTSNSYGGPGDGSSYYDGVNYLNSSGVLFVAAAGNGGTDNIGDDNDTTAYQPCGVNLPNVIAVANSTSGEVLSGSSNYGATTVDLAAPGAGILSTVSGGGTASYSGTSMACPQVAGAAALLYSYNPVLPHLDCKQALMDGVDKFAAYSNKCVSNGRLNVSRSLELIRFSKEPIIAFPYSQSFESNFGHWTATNGAFPWIRNTGTTPTAPDTGPTGAVDGVYYVFTEANGNNNKTGLLQARFNFGGLSAPKIGFSYHMFGNSIGSLYLEASTNGTVWNNLWSKSGNQGNQWFSTNVSLQAYGGRTNVYVRFRGTIVIFGFNGDIALDAISVEEGASAPVNDLDSDGLPNDWETQYFGGATNANPSAMASNGINTVRECYISGISPVSPSSIFLLSVLCPPSSGAVLRWNAVSGRVYSVYAASNLMNSFQSLQTNIAFPQAGYTDAVYNAGRFYKIGVRLAP